VIAACSFNILIEENAMNATFRNLFQLGALAALALVISPQFAAGQNPFRSAGDKITGDAYWPARASGQFIESARNYAQEVQTYVAKAPQPEPSVVKEIKTELGR